MTRKHTVNIITIGVTINYELTLSEEGKTLIKLLSILRDGQNVLERLSDATKRELVWELFMIHRGDVVAPNPMQ